MKKKNKKPLVIFLVILVVVEAIGIWYFWAASNKSTTNTTTTVSEKQVSTQTIEKTLTASGEIETASTQKLSLTTTKYFKTMCVEENDEVKQGENILQYTDGTYLTADYDCLISSYSVPETSAICTSSNYVEVKSLDSLQMTISVDETEIVYLTKGQSVEITISALDDKKYSGTISKINELGTYASSGTTFTATVTLENDDNIKLGMSASSTVVLQKVENVIAVPVEAIQTKQSEKYVVVVNGDGTTTDTTVTTGISDDEYVEIKSGLSGNEKIQVVTSSTTSTGTSSSSSSSNKQSIMSGTSGGMQSGGAMPSGGSMPSGGTMPSGSGASSSGTQK